MTSKGPATLAEVQRNGAVAAVLREQMGRLGLNQPQVAEAIGSHASSVSSWFRAKAIVPGKFRAPLAKLLGVPEASLNPADDALAATPTAPVASKRGAVDLLSFVISEPGQARLRLDATLPIDKAVPLLRMLLDAGIVFRHDD